MVILSEQDAQNEVLAGNSGQCTDYKRANDFGRSREPFTWLSDDGVDDANRTLAADLQRYKSGGTAVPFEAWELADDHWLNVFSGEVLVLYVEVDARLPKVRALLQWAQQGR